MGCLSMFGGFVKLFDFDYHGFSYFFLQNSSFKELRGSELNIFE